MDVAERWWNGGWGRLAENVWLGREADWRVIVRRGDAATGKVWHWDYPDEAAARAMVDRLTEARGPGEWRQMGGLNRTQPPELAAERRDRASARRSEMAAGGDS